MHSSVTATEQREPHLKEKPKLTSAVTHLLIFIVHGTFSSDGNKTGIVRPESNDGLVAPAAGCCPSLSLSESLFCSADVFNPDFIFNTSETLHHLWDSHHLSSQRWMFTLEQHPQTHATQVQARLVEAMESGFISSSTLTLCHWAVKNLSPTSNHLHRSFQLCHFVYYDVSLTFKPRHCLKYSPKMQMGYV